MEWKPYEHINIILYEKLTLKNPFFLGFKKLMITVFR